jgi:transposase
LTRNNTRKSKAIEALGHGLSVTDASEKAGVTRKTVYRWLEDDDFQGAVLERQNEVLERVSRRLSALALQGLDTLSELMNSDDESIRLRASSSVLSRFTEILELLRLEKRIEVLEGQVSDKKRL